MLSGFIEIRHLSGMSILSLYLSIYLWLCYDMSQPSWMYQPTSWCFDAFRWNAIPGLVRHKRFAWIAHTIKFYTFRYYLMMIMLMTIMMKKGFRCASLESWIVCRIGPMQLKSAFFFTNISWICSVWFGYGSLFHIRYHAAAQSIIFHFVISSSYHKN